MEELGTWVRAKRGRSSSLARGIGVPPSFIRKMVTGERGVPLEKCRPIEDFTCGAVTRKVLRPNDWHVHWPELASTALQS